MKKIFAIFLVLLTARCFATTYYVNNTTGSDAYTSVQAQNTATPWRTIAKLNTFTFSASDIILFNRGDVFYGGLIVSGSTLTFGAYGTGTNPLFSGFFNCYRMGKYWR